MARIRSVHPGLFTDADFVCLSDAAQIFFVGLWTEADDHGAFKWEPVTLKIRLRGASTMPVEPLLEELAGADRIRKYESDGRQYGVIRNFTRFQRPKFPKSQHFIPPELRSYAGSSEPITPTEGVERDAIPRNAEKPPQIGGGRIGGGRMEDGEEDGSEPNGSATADIAFAGRLIRLSRKDFQTWRKTYHAIPDLVAELQTLDDYYFTELKGKDRERWFIRCSAALDKKHQTYTAAAARPNGSFTIGVG